MAAPALTGGSHARHQAEGVSVRKAPGHQAPAPRTGQQGLYRRLYTPEAFGARLLGNLGRFHEVRYRPEPLRADNVATFVCLALHYWRQGRAARNFFWTTLWRALWHSPRSLSQTVLLLGMYQHVRQVHADARPGNPWAEGGGHQGEVAGGAGAGPGRG